jgi:DNA-binding MarR family transcriptional regulator
MVATARSRVGDAIGELQEMFLHLMWQEKRRFAQELVDFQLTVPQFITLMAIKNIEADCTMGRLAEATNQVSATVTGIVSRLVDHGWVKRGRLSGDRRAVVVRLTPKGYDVLDGVQQLKRARVQSMLAQFSLEEREQILAMLRRYVSLS